jgi:hypothetical protein
MPVSRACCSSSPVDDELNVVSPSMVFFVIVWNSNCNSKSEYAVPKLVVFDLVDEISFIAPQENKIQWS